MGRPRRRFVYGSRGADGRRISRGQPVQLEAFTEAANSAPFSSASNGRGASKRANPVEKSVGIFARRWRVWPGSTCES